MSNNSPYSFDYFIKTLKIMHLLFVLFLSCFLGYIYFSNDVWAVSFENSMTVVGVTAIVFLAVVVSNYIQKHKLKASKDFKSIKDVFENYQKAFIIKLAILEATTLLCCVVGKTTDNLYFVLLALGLVIYFISLRPSKKGVRAELSLNSETENQLS
ncbi:MAG: hypothetical protein BM564_03375 [Bacteroidetes bacterium MedPE-SWsnd-G2]|nr:MAG: hypothetical protein BM564_03375 [Bacteroidetes bacterium MedPE-SWsnd-G2]